MYVYYDEPHTIAVLGQQMATQYFTLSQQDFIGNLTVSVKEGSLIPKDSLTKRNEAIELWGAGAIDPITLFERLEDPNPHQRALQLLQWQQAPLMLFPELAAMMPAPVPAQPGQPGQPPAEAPQSELSQVPLNN